jgi:peptide deformylase
MSIDKGIKLKRRASGWQARVIMHENDLINGILFIDHLKTTHVNYGITTSKSGG